jgi:hypothetical protein
VKASKNIVVALLSLAFPFSPKLLRPLISVRVICHHPELRFPLLLSAAGRMLTRTLNWADDAKPDLNLPNYYYSQLFIHWQKKNLGNSAENPPLREEVFLD